MSKNSKKSSASLMLPPPTLAKRPKRAAKEQAQAALGHQDPLESDTSDDGARSPAPAPPQPAASCSKATKTPRGPKTAKLAYNSLPTALHDLVDKPIYESDKVTKDPYSAIAALEIHNMRKISYKMFALLPDEDRLEIERALPEFMREKLKIEGLAPKEMKEMLVLGLVERFRFIQGADDQSAARRGGYAGEDTGAEVMDPEAAAAMQAYETWKSQNAEERIPMEAFKSFFAHNVEFQTEYRTWQNEIAAGHMTDEFLAGFEKWSAEDEYKKSLKDVHYEAWWGEKADRSKLIAGASKVYTLQDLIKGTIVVKGDHLRYQRKFAALGKQIDRTVEITAVHPQNGLSIKLLPDGTGQGSASGNGKSCTVDNPTALETFILDCDARVPKVQRPNGNAWKCLSVVRETKGQWEDLGTLWVLRLNEFERVEGRISVEAPATTASKGKGKGKQPTKGKGKKK